MPEAQASGTLGPRHACLGILQRLLTPCFWKLHIDMFKYCTCVMSKDYAMPKCFAEFAGGWWDLTIIQTARVFPEYFSFFLVALLRDGWIDLWRLPKFKNSHVIPFGIFIPEKWLLGAATKNDSTKNFDKIFFLKSFQKQLGNQIWKIRKKILNVVYLYNSKKKFFFLNFKKNFNDLDFEHFPVEFRTEDSDSLHWQLWLKRDSFEWTLVLHVASFLLFHIFEFGKKTELEI